MECRIVQDASYTPPCQQACWPRGQQERRRPSATWSYISSAIAALVAIAIAGGCANSGKHAGSHGYETVGVDPRRDTDVAKAANGRAIVLLKSGKFADAEAELKKALDADVTFGPAHNNLGKVYYQQGQFYLAAWEFQYAAKLLPDLPEPRNNLGLVLESVGKLDDAVTWYDEALKLRPDNSQALGNDARARLRRGDRDPKVKDMLQRLLSLDTRPAWTEWARERLAVFPREDGQTPGPSPTSGPSSTGG